MDPTVKTYLDHATAGLRDDAELQLDVRAELASHVEDKAAELRRAGLPEPEAEAQALRALGAVTEIATEIEHGNRRRLNQRAWLRRALRFALVPAAVIVAVVCADFKWAAVVGMMDSLGGVQPPLAFERLRRWAERMTMRNPEAPVLKATARELWESNRTDRTYFANCITHDVAGKGGTDNAVRRDLLAQLEPAGELDPGNARYDYLRAAILLDGAAELQSESEKGPDGKPLPDKLSWTISDRARVDEAMAHLARGLAKPEFRRYGREMLALQLEAMGPPQDLLDQVRRVARSAAALLPDLAKLRQLGRATVLYGETLASEGKVAEARPFLDGWKTLTLHLNRDSWTLIDALVVTAIAHGISEHSAGVYERLGLAEEAARTRREGALLGGPGQEWRNRRSDPAAEEANKVHERELLLYGGVMMRLLLPALNEWPTPADYDANRRLEYVTAMHAAQIYLSGLLLLAMLACLVISLRWRLLSNGAVIPILLVPNGRQAARTLALGVLVPLLVFAGVALLVPIGGQAYAVQSGAHKLLAEFALLSVALLLVPAWLSIRFARRRCLELGVPCGSTAVPRLTIPALVCIGLAGVLAVLGFMQAPWPTGFPDLAVGLAALSGGVGLIVLLAGLRPGLRLLVGLVLCCSLAAAVSWCWPAVPGRPFVPGIAAGVAALVCLLVSAIVAGSRLLLARREVGLYCGTVARSLIPTFAAAVILICLTARPWLVHRERALLAADKVLVTGTDEVGFSRIENQLAERLKDAVESAAASLGQR
jgi:hypothetical protein